MQGGPDLSWLSGKFSFFFPFFLFGALGLSLSPFFPYFLLYFVSLFFSLSFPFLSTFASFAVTADFHLLLFFPLLPFSVCIIRAAFLPLSWAGNLYCLPALPRAALSTAEHNCWHTHSSYAQATKNLHSRFGEGGGDKRGALKRRCSILLADLPSFASLQ